MLYNKLNKNIGLYNILARLYIVKLNIFFKPCFFFLALSCCTVSH